MSKTNFQNSYAVLCVIIQTQNKKDLVLCNYITEVSHLATFSIRPSQPCTFEWPCCMWTALLKFFSCHFLFVFFPFLHIYTNSA